MDTSETNIIQYYEILDPSSFISDDDPVNPLALDALTTNSFTLKNDEPQQILYYIQSNPAEDTFRETSLILTDNDGLELSLDNDSYEPDILEETTTSEEIFKVITMQDGQIIMTETNNLDDIEINTDESCKENNRGFREIDLDGTRAFIEESVWQLFSNKDNTDLIASNIKPKRRKKETRRTAFHCRVEGCGKFYTSAGNLLVHTRSHTGLKPFSCPVSSCGKDFVTGYSLKTHLRCHSGEKPYPCLVCSKSFKTSGDLSKHLRTHTGERPFPCTIPGCNKRFTTSNIRKVHLRSHTGERPYICDFENCGKSFASATNQKNHIRIHTGEKPYACKIQNCSKRFTEYSSLHKHSLVHVMQSKRSTHGLALSAATTGATIALEFDVVNSSSFGQQQQQQISLMLSGDDDADGDCMATILLQPDKIEDDLDGFVGEVDDYIG